MSLNAIPMAEPVAYTPAQDGADATPRISCQDCVFAVFEGGDQTDCEFGRTAQFEQLGLLSEGRNERGAFANIHRLCSYRRSPKWKPDLSQAEKRQEVVKEAKTTVAAVVVCQDWPDPADWENALHFTLFGVFRSGFSEVVLVSNQDEVPYAALLTAFREVCDKAEMSWRFVRVVARKDDGSREPIDYAIDQGVKMVKRGTYYAALLPGQFVTDIPAALERLTNGELRRVIAVVPKDTRHGLVVHVNAHNSVGGSCAIVVTDENGRTETVTGTGEKLRRLAQETGESEMVLDALPQSCGCC